MNSKANFQYPEQSSWLGRRVEVIFNYDASICFAGIIVRDDKSDPFLTVIALEDGRVILGEECSFRCVSNNSEI